MPIYSVRETDLRLIRGVQNEILFCVRDIDRKPVNMAISDSLIVQIIDIPTATLLMRRVLYPIDLPKGLYQLVVMPNEMNDWPTGPVRWNMVRLRGTDVVMLWTDQTYSPSGVLYIDKGWERTDSPESSMPTPPVPPMPTPPIPAAPACVPEAPTDGQVYGRQGSTKTWREVVTPDEDLDIDGGEY